MTPFQQAVAKVFEEEKGYVNHKNDRGGATNYGITVAVARRAGWQGSMKDLPKPLAESIYNTQYWETSWLRLDIIAKASNEIAFILFDVSVNSGPLAAGKLLQRALNLLNRAELEELDDLVVDGWLGTQSRNRLQFFLTQQDEQNIILALTGLRFHFYINIIQRRPSQRSFTRGWLKRAGKGLHE